MNTRTTLLLAALLPALGLALRAEQAATPSLGPVVELPSGTYLEARSATVWGGACHINAEIVTQERQALVTYAFEGGRHAGEDLQGVRVVLALEGEDPLSQAPAQRGRAWTAGGDVPAQRAALAWCCAGLGLDLGAVTSEHDGPVALDHARLHAQVGELVKLEGDPVPDDACCTMPESRWYPTLDGRVPESRVALGEVCSVRPDAGAPRDHEPWALTGSNNLQYGRFGARP